VVAFPPMCWCISGVRQVRSRMRAPLRKTPRVNIWAYLH